MKNLGDITKISGYNAPTVDVVIGGSPCQDLSVAGKRAGLAGERSGLYMEQIRIIKEMRERDKTAGRTDRFVRPRYMVWENVPGAFSSNHGKDFAAVLEEAVGIVEPEVPHVPVPEKGWPTSGCLMGDGWSVAWRVLDAQFWGVPQRRRRIALVADFGGHTAPEILFVRKSLSGDSEPGGTEGKGSAGDAENGIRAAVYGLDHVMLSGGTTHQGRGWYYDVSGCLKTQAHGVCCLNDQVGSVMSASEDVADTLREQEHGHKPAICIQGNCIDRADTAGCNGKGWRDDDISFTLNTVDRPAVYDARGNGDGAVVPTITGDHESMVTGYTAVCIGNGQADIASHITEDVAQTLNCMHDQQAVMTYMSMQAIGEYSESDVASSCKQRDYKDATDLICAVDCRNGTENPDINGTLQSMPNGGMSLNLQNVVRECSAVRRLTPLECERLQGFPSEKKWDVSKMTKDEYIAWNLAEKNIIVDAEKGVVYGTRGPGGIPYKEPKQLKGSVVNGYNVVSLRNGATKLQCRVHRIVWISQNGIIPEGYCIDHINNDKQDNRISNLQIMTPSENSKKAKEDGLYAEGLDNKATKLDPDLHDELCYLYEFSDLTQRELAEIYGISKSRVNQIIKEVGWTDIGDWVDSKGKKRKTTDSARYKALGNSIALPPWKWVLKRLCAQYERDATMASLFDGIGGFPLIWEQLNGRGSCLWASEIDEFPIAVTRQRFGEEQ